MKNKELLKIIIMAANDKQADDIVALDVNNVSLLADYFVIMQANSNRQMKSITDNIEKETLKNGYTIRNIEGTTDSNWILIDFNDVIVHIFSPEIRHFYNLDKFWSEANLLDISDWID